ncbi:phytanoyl-CoA dioxygenase family protein [Paenibacillus sp. MWE-103]|uniref:Phytanoyl-CoA dioxygenase family protein n=1 Tax=Paenibacillus artemisiicola TaxID=1172618 RepID=A0ABS3W4A7_9BACL|nr:phytanoyl-CoA dioxygenase family protein [Paenibacillus artemisiicola]MBO7743132.1 phytanoyl-CoA dioxygenase family protein [Paenibacillus artemisiicola]
MTNITKEQVDFFRHNGYVKLEGIVPKANCDRVIEAIWSCLGKDASDPENWYNPPQSVMNRDGMVEMYHHQTMWDNRQLEEVYGAFSTLLDEEKLWVSIDRVNMKPPVRADKQHLDNSFIHWDTDTSVLPRPIPKGRKVQGVLYLADTEANQGGFQCVPEIYRDLEQYLDRQPADRNPRVPDLTGYDVQPIPGKAGDLLIWDVLLAHGNGHNRNTVPRYAQYITMYPEGNEQTREQRVKMWRERSAPENHHAFPGDPRKWEQTEFDGPPELTPLGRKLLGLDAWGDA